MKNRIFQYFELRNFLILSVLISSISGLEAQTSYPLYYSQQTGQSSMYRGNAQKTTDKSESGIANIKLSGPILATVNPEIKINTSETKNWDGKISVDGTKAPETGKSVMASLTGDYSITYSRPKGRGVLSQDEKITGQINYGEDGEDDSKRGEHEIINKTGSLTIPFVVYSIDCQFKLIPEEVCPNKPFFVTAVGYPEGGKIIWHDGYEGSSRSISISKDTTVWANYEIQGVNFKIKQKIKVGNSNKWELANNSASTPANFEIEGTLRDLISRLPGSESFLVEGPFVTKKVYSRECCSSDSSKTKLKEEKVSGVVSFNLKANQVDLQERPYRGRFHRRINRFGYTFELSGNYETSISFNGSIEGNYNHFLTSCGTKGCNSESANFTIPVKMTVATNGAAKMIFYGKKQNQQEIPYTSSKVDVFPMIKGKIAFNQNSCSDGLRYKVGISETVANIKAKVGEYDINFPLTITPGFDLIRNY